MTEKEVIQKLKAHPFFKTMERTELEIIEKLDSDDIEELTGQRLPLLRDIFADRKDVVVEDNLVKINVENFIGDERKEVEKSGEAGNEMLMHTAYMLEDRFIITQDGLTRDIVRYNLPAAYIESKYAFQRWWQLNEAYTDPRQAAFKRMYQQTGIILPTDRKDHK